MITNEQVIKNNIQMYQISVDKMERKKNIKRLTKKEEKRYKEKLEDLDREKARLKELELLGEEFYTKIYPHR